MTWTQELVDELKRLNSTGASAREMACALNVGRNSILGKLFRLGLSGPPRPKATTPKLRARRKRPFNNGGADQAAEHAIAMRGKLLEPPPVAVEDAAIPIGQRRTLMQLENHHCRFPIGDGADIWFCGAAADVAAGQSYCTEHARRAFTQRPRGAPFIPRRGTSA